MTYLIYGSERVLIDKKVEEIKKKNVDIDLNSIVSYDMREHNISTAINDLLTISMFGDRKIVICKDCFFLTGTSIKTEFEHNLNMLNDYVLKENDNILILIVNNDKIDTRKKIVKNIEKNVEVINVGDGKKYGEKYIIDSFNEKGISISYDAASYLLNKVGNELSFLENEFEKLALYKSDEKNITINDIDLLISKSLDDNIFELIEKILTNDKKEIFRIYNDLILLKEEPIKIIVMIANQFRLIYQTKLLIKKGFTEKDIASLYTIHPYRVKLAVINSKKFDDMTLRKYLLKLADLDIKIKTGEIDKNIGLELFFLKM